MSTLEARYSKTTNYEIACIDITGVGLGDDFIELCRRTGFPPYDPPRGLAHLVDGYNHQIRRTLKERRCQPQP